MQGIQKNVVKVRTLKLHLKFPSLIKAEKVSKYYIYIYTYTYIYTYIHIHTHTYTLIIQEHEFVVG